MRWAWRLQKYKENYQLGLAIIGCMNDDGYLDSGLQTLSEGLGVSFLNWKKF